jgi:thiol-disulfide isomerase/thioredoxin
VRRSPTVPVLIIFSLLLLIISGCDKKHEEKNLFEQTSREEPKETQAPEIQTPETQTPEILQAGKDRQEQNTTTLYPSSGDTFCLCDIKEQNHTVSVEEKQLFFKDISQPIVIIHFFSPWSLPCKAEVPYLSDLQKKYPKELFILGILLNPKDHADELGTFIQENHADYYISESKENNAFTRKILKQLHLPDIMPIPLTVIYRNGHYYRHYEGAIPIEMIEHDIKVLLEE